MRTFLEPDYLSEEYFELVRYAALEALKRGMRMWIYDESGWPSGGANYRTVSECPECAVTLIESRTVELSCGEKYVGCGNFVCAFIEKKRIYEGHICTEDCTAEEFYTRPFGKNPNIVDLTNPSSAETFINNTYEKYRECLGEYFGERIPLFFTDEPALMCNCLPYGGFEAFEKKYGYDIRDYLYVIKDFGKEAENEKEIQARIDFGEHIGTLLRDNTFIPLRDWCRKNNISFGGHLNLDSLAEGGMACGHFSHIDCLRKFDVPGIDVIWEQIRYPYGGRSCLDEETRDFPHFPRLASSAARLEGGVRALSESFAVYGDGITPEEIGTYSNMPGKQAHFEERRAPLTLGAVRLEKLTRQRQLTY